MSDDIFRKHHDAEQGLTLLADLLPGVWRRMYQNLIESGFREDQAMTILNTYIYATCHPAQNTGDKE